MGLFQPAQLAPMSSSCLQSCLHVVLYALFATQEVHARCVDRQLPLTVQEEQAAQLQAQVSAKERFIMTLRRTLTNANGESHQALSGYTFFQAGSNHCK